MPTAPQTGILLPLPREARFVELSLRPGADPVAVRAALAAVEPGENLVIGLGPSLVETLGLSVPGLRAHPQHVGAGFEVPSTPGAVWLRVSGSDRGVIAHAERALLAALGDAFEVLRGVDGFTYAEGRDLSGYVDGTENPEGDAAADAAIATDGALAGSSFVAAQQWVHDMPALGRMSEGQRDHTVGRRRSDNEELADAPASAHVKRAAQESFSPEAFLVRRSMPWADGARMGLYFVAFGRTLDAYEAILARMCGVEDGVPDGLFRFTRPVSGACYWCPPVRDGRLLLEG